MIYKALTNLSFLHSAPVTSLQDVLAFDSENPLVPLLIRKTLGIICIWELYAPGVIEDIIYITRNMSLGTDLQRPGHLDDENSKDKRQVECDTDNCKEIERLLRIFRRPDKVQSVLFLNDNRLAGAWRFKFKEERENKGRLYWANGSLNEDIPKTRFSFFLRHVLI